MNNAPIGRFDSSFDSNADDVSAHGGGRRRTRTGRRGNAEGSIYRRSDGRWVAALTDPRTGGRRYWYGKTRTDAAGKLNRAMRARDDGLRLTEGRETVADFLTRWEQEVGRSTLRPSTFASYSGIVHKHLVPTIGKARLTALDPEHVQTLMGRKLAAGLSTRRVLYIRAVLRRALADAMRWGLVSRNVAALARGPKHEPGEVEPLSPDHVDRFLEHVADDRLAALYVVALGLGLRQGEALGLRWEDIDLEQGYLRVSLALQRVDGVLTLVPPKTKRSRRTIHLPPAVAEALADHRQRQVAERARAGRRWRDEGFVFTTREGSPLDGSTVTHAFQRHLAKAGLPRHRFHDLRHTCASYLLAEEVSPRVVMDVLGHSQVSVTLNTYSHLMPGVQPKAMQRMDGLLRRGFSRSRAPGARLDREAG